MNREMNCLNCFGLNCFTSTSEEAAGPPEAQGRVISSSQQLALDAWYLRMTRDKNLTVKVRAFTLKELEDATDNFNRERSLGRIYIGYLSKEKQVLAVKKLDFLRGEGFGDFVAEVRTLDKVNHPNIIKLIGYCAEKNQRVWVYEFMPLRCLKTHLFDLKPGTEPLDWNTRMQIINGVAKGLEYLHYQLNPCIVYGNLKCSNILLDQEYRVKLSNFRFAKEVPIFEKMKALGYTAPEYTRMCNSSVKSDVYSFGVVLLEIITGRKAYDNTKPLSEHRLIDWAKPLLENKNNFPRLVDPSLRGQYPINGLHRALAIAASCINRVHDKRPTIRDVIRDVEFLLVHNYESLATFIVEEGQSSGVGTQTEILELDTDTHF